MIHMLFIFPDVLQYLQYLPLGIQSSWFVRWLYQVFWGFYAMWQSLPSGDEGKGIDDLQTLSDPVRAV